MFTYSKLPHNLFYTNKNDPPNSKSILKETDNDKALIILDYIYNHITRLDTIGFTIEGIVTGCGCGFIPNNRAPYTVKVKDKPDVTVIRVNQQFRDVLHKLQELKIITLLDKNIDLKIVNPKDFIICTLDIPMINQYIELYYTEKDTILKYDKEKIDNLKLLVYYCYLKCRMYRRSKKDGDLDATGGSAEVCNPAYELIHTELGLTDETITKFNNILTSLKLIMIDNPGFYYYQGETVRALKESPNMYSLWLGNKEDTIHNLKQGIKQYRALSTNSTKIFTNDRTYKNNNRQVNGKISSIKKKEIRGTATLEDLQEKQKLTDSITPNAPLQAMLGLLKTNEGMLLSDIYFELYNDFEKTEEYTIVEDSLGLIDADNNLLVEWDYYTWVITNYFYGDHEKDKQFYKNCVQNNLIIKNTLKKGKGLTDLRKLSTKVTKDMGEDLPF